MAPREMSEMNSKQLHGLAVLSLDSGEKLGSLARTYVDGPKKRIAGFAFTESGGFMQVESEPNIDAGDVHTVGPDAIIVDSRDAVHGRNVNEHFADYLVLDELAHRPVLSANGTSVGQVASLDFDNHSLELTEIEVSSGRFAANRTISMRQVITVGRDYVIVDDGAVRVEQEITEPMPDIVAESSPA
jgi:sporulation protein YlmC with PRC-barrel domain